LPHEWILRESDDLFLSWPTEEYQQLLSVEAFRDGRGVLVHFTPGVAFPAIEAARVELRRYYAPWGIIEDAVSYTLHADVCPELGRLTAFVEDGSPFPTCDAVVQRVRWWCAEFASAERVREVIEDEALLVAWCGRDRDARDYETLVAGKCAAGHEIEWSVLEAGGLVRPR